jgi:predicted ArsR family transcriptional regulator
VKAKPKLKITRAAKASETKLQRLERMLRRPEGATVAELAANLDWQPHSVRGAMSNLKKRRGLSISAEDVQGGQRTYRIAH